MNLLDPAANLLFPRSVDFRVAGVQFLGQATHTSSLTFSGGQWRVSSTIRSSVIGTVFMTGALGLGFNARGGCRRIRFMALKRKSTEMEANNWIALEKVAARCGCLYGDKPSWQRLLTLISRGVLVVSVKDKHAVHYLRKPREWTKPELQESAERDRLRQERIRRAAGIPPRSKSPPYHEP